MMSRQLNQTLMPDNFSYSGDITSLLTCISPRWEGRIERLSDSVVSLNQINKGCGISSYLINILVTQNRRPVIIQEESWTLNTSQTSINNSRQISGIIDGYGKTNDMFYHLWYFLDENLHSLGYGLTKQPKTTCTELASNAAKNTTFDFPVNSKQGWQFSGGARVSVYVSDEEWNSGTVVAVSSSIVTIALDNYYTITSGNTPTIKQWGNDYLKPWDITKSEINQTQILISDYYLLCAENQIYINSEGNIQMVYDPGTGFNIISWWDEDITSPAMILHPNYMRCEGNTVINPLSPIAGTDTRNLISDMRFIRAKNGDPTGTLQDDAFQGHRHYIETSTGTELSFTARITGSDRRVDLPDSTAPSGKKGQTGDFFEYGSNGTPKIADETRPKNISMVPIVKVLP